ncbi:MAG: hypothetical protein Q9162_007101 [Coniocarpon cinnabarinum]
MSSSSDEKVNNDIPGKTEDRSSSESPSKVVVGQPHPTLPGIARGDGKRELTENDCYDRLGYTWPSWKKWTVLSVIFTVQLSMNFNTSTYPNMVTQLSEYFHISEQAARVGDMIFLVLYAFGSELWAPWSEEFGRWPILQLSLFLVNIWQLPVALAPNFASVVVGRALGGLSSAGGSVTLGMVADLWEANDQQWAIAFVVLSSVGGTSIGPIVGGPIEKFLDWRWNPWVQLIFGGATQIIHFFLVPETRSTIMMDKEAKRRRKSGEDPDIYGPNELKKPRISTKEIATVWIRPFEMFVREPIVLSLSLLSGFSDALIFTFMQGFKPIFQQWQFGTNEQAWAFIPVVVGYFIGYFSFFPWIWKDQKTRRVHGPDSLQPERRLKWLLFTAPLEPIGLFGFAWTSLGPSRNHWFGPMFFTCVIAIANYAIYMATIDYMVASYGVYSASATGGNALARDFLAGIAALYSTPMYSNIGANTGYKLEYASTVLACLAVVVVIPIFIFYWKGPEVRKRSKFAQELAADRKKNEGRRASRIGSMDAEASAGTPKQL